MRLYAARKLAPGDVVTIRYESLSSDYACRFYGFVPRRNEVRDEVLLPLSAFLEGGDGADCGGGALSSLDGYMLHSLHPSTPSRSLLREGEGVIGLGQLENSGLPSGSYGRGGAERGRRLRGGTPAEG